MKILGETNCLMLEPTAQEITEFVKLFGGRFWMNYGKYSFMSVRLKDLSKYDLRQIQYWSHLPFKNTEIIFFYI